MKIVSAKSEILPKTRKKQTVCSAKIEILVYILAQALGYFLYYYENLISGELDYIMLPLVCFLFGSIINMLLIAQFKSHTAFIVLHLLLTQISMLGGDNFQSIKLNNEQLHNKLFMSLIQFSCTLAGRIPYNDYKQTGLIYGCIFITVCLNQSILFISFTDMSFMGGFMLWSSWTTWKYLRVLDDIAEFEARQPSKEFVEKLNEQKQTILIQDYIMMEGISDCIFLTQLLQDNSKFKFSYVNEPFQLNFNTKIGLENILAHMKVQNKEIIIYIQKKIFKLLYGQSPINIEKIFISKNNIPHLSHNNMGSYGQLNQYEQQRQYQQNQSPQDLGSQNECEEADERINHMQYKNNSRQQMNGLEQQFWQLDQLKLCIEGIKQNKEKDSKFELKRIKDKYVEYLNMQDILFVMLLYMKNKDKNKNEESQKQKKPFQQKMKDIEVIYENIPYQVQLFQCQFHSKNSVFFSMRKKTQYIKNEINNNYNNEVAQRMFQFFKNSTEKIQKSITSLLCKFGNQLFQLQKKDNKNKINLFSKFSKIYFFQNRENEYFQLIKYYFINYQIVQEIFKFQTHKQRNTIKMKMKDTEEFRELLQEQYEQNLNGRNNEIKIQQQNITQFKFQQLINDIKCIFEAEVSLKSTSIDYKPDDDDNKLLYQDYEKLKRILIQLIENSLSYQKAGIIQIEVKVYTQNSLRVLIKDNQNNLNKEDVKNIHDKGYSEKGFGFALVNELLKAIKPKSQTIPLQIKKDKHNDKTLIYFWIAQNLLDEYQDQYHPQIITNTNLSHFANMNGTHQEFMHDQKDKKYIEASNASCQQRIEYFIQKNQNQFDGSQYQNRHFSQQQLASHLNSPGKVLKFYSELYRDQHEILLNFPAPQNFLNFYIKKTISPQKALQQGGQNNLIGQNNNTQNNNFFSNPNNVNPQQKSNVNIMQNIFNNTIQNNNQNNQQFNNNIFNKSIQQNQFFNNQTIKTINNKETKPLFLIVSCDFRISNSLKTLLIQMCGNEDSVQFAQNKNILKEKLKKYDFEFILIDQLDGIQIRDIFEIINKKYKIKKKIQKVICFDYNGNVKRNFENEIPLYQNDQNFNETKSVIQYSALANFNNQNPFFNNSQNFGKDKIIKEQSNRNFRDSSLDSQEIIPSEPSNNQNMHDNSQPEKVFEFTTNRSNKVINGPEIENTELSNNNLMAKIKAQQIAQQPIQPKRPSKMNSPVMNSSSQINGLNQFNGASEINDLYETNGYAKTNQITQMKGAPKINGITQMNNANQKKNQINISQQNVSFQYDEVGMNEGYKNTSINYQQGIQKYKTLSPIQTIQPPHPRITGIDSEQNSIRTSTNRNRTPSNGHDEERGNHQNISSNKNSPPIHPKNANMQKLNAKKSQYMRQESQKSQKNQKHFKYIDNDDKSIGTYQRQIEMTFLQRNEQGFMQGSFPTKQNQSVELESCVKFFYYTLQHPFGYTQIYEAIYHINIIQDFSSENFFFFNLNTPERYFQ